MSAEVRPLVKDAGTGTLLLLLGAAVLVVTSSSPWGAPAADNPVLLPRVAGVGLLLTGGALLVGAIAARAGAIPARIAGSSRSDLPIALPVEVPEELRRGDEAEGTDWRQAAVVAAALVGYGVLAFRLGFVVSTVAFVLGAGLLLGHGRGARSAVGLAVFALVLAGTAYVAFFVLLDVRVPSTPLP